MILVPVGEDHGLDRPVVEVREVREHEVDAEVLVARERETGVDDDRRLAELEDGHVLPDLAETAERDDPERATHRPECTARSRRVG